MAFCIGLMLLASCKKEVLPTIGIATGGNYAGQDTEMFAGDPITVGFSVTGENLTKIEMNASQNGTALYTDAQNIDNQAAYLYVHNFILDAVGTVTISGTVTDAKGHTATMSFDITCYEKPNAKFVGQYDGSVLLNGTFNVEQNGQGSFSNEMNDYDVPVVMQLEPGATANEVIGTITINNEQPNDIQGIVNGNTVTFEAINAEFSMTVPVGGFSVSPTLNMTYNIVGTLEDNILKLNGECKGDGEFNIPFFGNGDINLDANINGSLTKTE